MSEQAVQAAEGWRNHYEHALEGTCPADGDLQVCLVQGTCVVYGGTCLTQSLPMQMSFRASFYLSPLELPAVFTSDVTVPRQPSPGKRSCLQ